MNRILQFCQCDCWKKKRKHEKAEECADLIQELAGDIIEVSYPTIADATGDVDGYPEIMCYINAEIQKTSDYANARSFFADQFRKIGAELWEAANRLEGLDTPD